MSPPTHLRKVKTGKLTEMEKVNSSGLTVEEKSVLEALIYRKPFLNDHIWMNSGSTVENITHRMTEISYS